ncbi:MAG: PAS domain S-box protein [Nitrospirae bacterium]|nr:PAS domain S-box protein [Nitrospirota bacterium]
MKDNNDKNNTFHFELKALRKAIETMQLGVTITDTEGTIIFTNEAEAGMHGYTVEELIGKNVRIFAPEDKWSPLPVDDMKRIKRWKRETINVHKDGSTFPVQLLSDLIVDDEGNPLGIVTTCENITERKKVEEELKQAKEDLENKVRERTIELSKTIVMLYNQIEERKKAEEEREKLRAQLLHTQKMEAIGQMAAGIAHDFNNFLSAILGYTTLLMQKIPRNDPLRAYIEGILTATEKSETLVQDLLSFTRQKELAFRPVNVSDSVRTIVKMLSRITREDIELRVAIHDEQLTVMADTAHLEQVFLNIAKNAYDAMPNGGVLTIEIDRYTMDKSFTLEHGYGSSGKYARISFKDTGIGMDEKTIQKIFDPFFTTKEEGKGTGLGLSVSYGIIKDHKGFITVKSRPGEGSEFQIFLPTVKRGEVKKEDITDTALFNGKHETILFAEDNKEVREMLSALLEEFNYNVISSANGDEAIEKFMRYKDQIDLLICDIIMPQRNGKEVDDYIKSIRSDIKTIFITGYPEEVIKRVFLSDKNHLILQKPIAPHTLLSHIRELLNK